MKNRILTFLAIGFVLAFFNPAQAQQNFSEESAVSFDNNISLTFNLKTTLPDKKSYQTVGYIGTEGTDEDKEVSRVHRIVADRAGGVYFGYDVVVRPSGVAGNYTVSFQPLSKSLSELYLLNGIAQLPPNSAAQRLPKYPEDMKVEDGDTIALDILYNPATKVKIVDFIKITTKKPRDFTLNAVKLRLASPRLHGNGNVGSLPGSEWKGVIEGSVIHIYIPGKGRFIFSLFPQNGLDFQKNATIDDSRIIFQSNGERYEVISAAPILSSGGNWNLWTLHDSSYQPDSTFNADAASYVEYGASNEVGSLLKQEWRKSKSLTAGQQGDKAQLYTKWVDEVRYIISDAEKETFSQLQSDPEREEFIQAFWQRRDTTPETKQNEFRREYYNRMAYANETFGFGKTPGWLTDRGRIFMTYGKPDKVEKEALREIWSYNSSSDSGKNVTFEFKAKVEGGDFRLPQ